MIKKGELESLNNHRRSNSNIDTESETNNSVHSKDKLMHSFITAIEHLLPIDHKSHNKSSSSTNSSNDTHLSHQNKRKSLPNIEMNGNNIDDEYTEIPDNGDIVNTSINSIQSDSLNNSKELGRGRRNNSHSPNSDNVFRSNSFLNNLNSILQTNGHVNPPGNGIGKNRTLALDDAKRSSIFSDSALVLNKKNRESSPLKDSSLRSIDFNHVSRPRDESNDAGTTEDEDEDYEDEDEDDDIGDIREDEDPELEIKDEDFKEPSINSDDYIVNLDHNKNMQLHHKLVVPQRTVSDVPQRSNTLHIPKLEISNSIDSENTRESTGDSSKNSKTSVPSANKHRPDDYKRSGTISIAPLALTKLKSKNRRASINKQDLIDTRGKNTSTTCLYSLSRAKSDASTKSKEEERHHIPDYPDEVFSCALQKDILLQGKLYLTKDEIKFQSKIFNIKTNILIPIKDIVQIEKKFTAVLFPNAIVIKTVDKDYIFASFLNRDSVFEKIMTRWGDVIMQGINENNNSTSESEKLTAEKPTPKKMESDLRKNSNRKQSTSKDNNDGKLELPKKSKSTNNITFKLPEIFDAQGDALKLSSPVKQLIHGITDTDESDDEGSSSNEEESMTSDDEYEPEENGKNTEEDNNDNKSGSSSVSFGPSVGKPYNPDLSPYSKDVDISNDVIKNTSLGTIFKIFSDEMGFILEKCGNYNISDVEKLYPYGDDTSKLNGTDFKRYYTYTKPLNSSLGPKETSCQVTDSLIDVDLNKSFTIKQTTETPDVPSGKSFHVITHIIVFWSGEANVTIRSFTKVVWTGKSWIKGPVENGNTSGQKQSMQLLVKTVQELSNDYKTSQQQQQQPGSLKKKSSKRKVPKKQSSDKKKPEIDSRAESEKPETAPQAEVNIIGKFLNSLSDSKNITTYLTWLIVFYLLFDKIFVSKKTIIINESYTPQSLKNSEEGIWSWVLERTDGISINENDVTKVNQSNSFDASSLKHYSKQELFGIKELKEKELQMVERLLNN